MSDNKLKSFFSVFTQCFSQAICDIDLCYQNLNCLMDEKEQKTREEEDDDDDDDDDEFGGSSSSDDELSGLYSNKRGRKRRKSKSTLTAIHDANKTKIRQLCMELYGISSVLLKCSLIDPSRYSRKKQKDLTLVEKIIHVMKFIQISKNALLYELQKAYYQMNELDGNDMSNFDLNQVKFKIETSRINEIIIIIGRKLSIDDHMIEEIDRTNDDQIGILAQMRVKAVFNSIIKAQDLNKLFKNKPLSRMAVATDILQYVFGIENNEANDSYLN